MKKELCSAVMASIEALLQVPGTQLQTIESTLRQLLTDLKKAGITPPADLDTLIEDAAVAKAENAAYMNGIADPEEPEDDWFNMMSEEEQEAYMAWEAHMNECGGADLI